MDNSIKPGLLNDTYNLVQLARESALAQGRQAQADKLSPVVDHLKTLVSNNQAGSKPVQASLSAAKTTNSVPAASERGGRSK